jgi:Gal80-like protein
MRPRAGLTWAMMCLAVMFTPWIQRMVQLCSSWIGGHAIFAVQSVLGRIEEVGTVLSQRRQTVRVIETGEMIPMRTPDPLVLDAVLQSGAPLSFQLRGGLPRNRRVHRNRQTRASCLMLSLSPSGWASDKLPLKICYFPDLFEDLRARL